MSLAAKIEIAARRLRALGVEPASITMGVKFHSALCAELEGCRMYLRPDEPIAEIRTFNGLTVVVAETAVPDQAWIGVGIK